MYSGDKLHIQTFLSERVFFILSFIEKYGKQLLIPTSIGIAIIGYIFFFQDNPSQHSIETINTNSTLAAIPPDETVQPTEVVDEIPQPLLVDVKGAVRYPGVYTLEEGQRIVDAIEMAGGYIEQANPSHINHAQKLQDEMVIYIPKIGEVLSESIEQLIQTPQQSSSTSTSSSGKVNVNKAEESELTTLPGIGPSKAKAIIQYRTEQGTFQTIDDLKKVTGIGEKTFEQLKDLIDVK